MVLPWSGERERPRYGNDGHRCLCLHSCPGMPPRFKARIPGIVRRRLQPYPITLALCAPLGAHIRCHSKPGVLRWYSKMKRISAVLHSQTSKLVSEQLLLGGGVRCCCDAPESMQVTTVAGGLLLLASICRVILNKQGRCYGFAGAWN